MPNGSITTVTSDGEYTYQRECECGATKTMTKPLRYSSGILTVTNYSSPYTFGIGDAGKKILNINIEVEASPNQPIDVITTQTTAELYVFETSLRVDTTADGQITESDEKDEDDLQKTRASFVLNLGDKNHNGIPDYADLAPMKTEAFEEMHLLVPGFPLNEYDVDVAFVYDGANLVTPPTTGVYPSPQGSMRLWKKSSMVQRADTDYIKPSSSLAGGTFTYYPVTGFESKGGTPGHYKLYIEGLTGYNSKKVDLYVRITDKSDGKVIPDWRLALINPCDSVEAHAIDMFIKPGFIHSNYTDYQLSGRTINYSQPWSWWINDDEDKDSDPSTGLSNDSSLLPSNPDDKPGQGDPDYNDGKINGVRDLVDFFPLQFVIDYDTFYHKAGERPEFYIKSDSPINFVYNVRHSNGFSSLDYIQRSYSEADRFKAAPVIKVDPSAEPVLLDESKLIGPNHRGGGLAGTLFVEAAGASSTDSSITIIAKNGGRVLGEVNLPVKFSSVTDMFRQKDFRKDMGASDDKPIVDRLTLTNLPYNMIELDPQGVPLAESQQKNLFWVHGYNNDTDAATATFTEVFKRLYWQGFKGNFIGCSWFGDPKTLGSNYHQTVVNSHHAAKLFGEFVQNYSGENYLVGHSMGNMVVGLAINEQHISSTAYEKYFAIDAAVALEAYGQVDPHEWMLSFDTNDAGFHWLDYYNYQSVSGSNDYPARKLLPSEWYQLFENSNDNRKKLTWRKRLDEVVKGGKMINFYSSTEEVLRKYELDNFIWDDAGWGKDELGFFAWVKQEKFKGRRDELINIPLINTDEALGVSSDYCGWRYNTEYKKLSWNPLQLFLKHMEPADAALIDNEKLKSEPYFEIGGRSLGDGKSLTPLFGPTGTTDDFKHNVSVKGSVTRLTPSEFVDQTVVDLDDFKDYDVKNDITKAHVKMRDWLLALAFPATTLPMGANRLSANGFNNANNIDMSSVAVPDGNGGFTGGCKANEAHWPLDDRPKFGGDKDEHLGWWHSDYKDLPYQFTYPFYNNIVQKMK